MTRSLLLKLRRRLLAQAFARAAAWALLAGAIAVAMLAAALAILRHPAGELLAWSGAVAGAGALGGAALWAILRRPSLEEVAAQVDRAAATHDRLATALAFGNAPGSPEPLRRAALAECEAFLSAFDGRRWTPWQMPRALPWLCLPLLGMALIHFFAPAPLLPVARKEDPAVMEAARRLEEIAKKLESQHQESSELKKMAEALKKSAAELRAAAKGESPEKARLRELSAIEDLVKAASQNNDMEALARALDQMDATQAAAAAAEAMRQRDVEAAAAGMEEVGRGLAAETDAERRERQLGQLEKAMSQAAQQLGEQTPLGAAASKASRAGQRRDGQGAQQALAQLGEALRQARAGQSDRAGKGQSPDSKELQALLAALREMKMRQGQGEGQGKGEEGEGGQMLALAPPGDGNSQGRQMAGAGENASGQPGSEHDEGTKANPFGAEGPPPPAPEMQAQIQGLLGEGESLHTLLPSQAGEEPARQGYKALYEAAAPAAEEALEKENIPLGSRLFVKRYFESIRPKQ